MCGILAILGSSKGEAELRTLALTLSKRLRHRGPDWSGVWSDGKGNVLSHERLAIIDPFSGGQPLIGPSGVVLTVNGEVYNYRKLRALPECQSYQFQTESDCEPIIPLYMHHGPALCKMLDGEFAFVLHDPSTGNFLAARDPIGVASLYVGYMDDGAMVIASELKALHDVCSKLEVFPPGHYLTNTAKGFQRYYDPRWLVDQAFIPKVPADLVTTTIHFNNKQQQNIILKK